VKPHIFHPDAGEEYARAVEYYAAITPELGSRFHDEIERLIHDVRRQPERFFHFSPPAQRALAASFLIRWSIWTSRIACGLWPSCTPSGVPVTGANDSVEDVLDKTTRRSSCAIWLVYLSCFNLSGEKLIY